MCINDLYTCKDSSRINCTLACNTLGYIPCRNYMDKKICSSIIRKTNKFSNFKSFKENSFQFINSAGSKEIDVLGSKFSISDSILFTVLGLIIMGSIFLFLFLCSIRLQQKRRKNLPKTNNSTSSISINNSEEDNHQIISTDNNHNNRLLDYQADPNEQLKKSFKHSNSYKQNDEINLTSDSNNQINRLDISEQNYSIKSPKKCDVNNLDYQIYGEPPPSYQQSKYFPVIKLKDFKEEDAHIYENIDESTNVSAKQRKGKFKTLNTKEPTSKTHNKASKFKSRSDSFQSSSTNNRESSSSIDDV